MSLGEPQLDRTDGQEVSEMKNTTFSLILLCSLSLVLLAGPALAADEQAAEKSPEQKLAKMDGKELFKTFCKSCHGPEAKADEYTPMSLIMEQWEEFFSETFADTHKEIACPKDETKMVTDILDKDMLKKIKKFCVDHAADSEQPMTCG